MACLTSCNLDLKVSVDLSAALETRQILETLDGPAQTLFGAVRQGPAFDAGVVGPLLRSGRTLVEALVVVDLERLLLVGVVQVQHGPLRQALAFLDATPILVL